MRGGGGEEVIEVGALLRHEAGERQTVANALANAEWPTLWLAVLGWHQIVQSKRPFDSYSLRWEGRRRVGEGIHCTALEQVTRKVLDAYTVRTRVRVHAYGYTFIARYAHDSTVTVRGSSVHLAVAMAFAPPASKHASRVANVGHFHHILPLIEGSPTPRHRRRRATWANQMGLMGHVASVR